MSILIGNQCVVSIHYTLKDDDGVVIDSSSGKEPLTYLHGAGNIIPGLENELVGKTAGASCTVVVAPEDGYGVKSDDLMQVVPLSAFEGVENVEVGMQFQVQGPDGGAQVITVAEVAGEEVTIDGNHPLASKTLHFDVSIEAVRDATPEEIAHGHVH
jgi:FKBP-type peptidyl-prolyl cis-trans isomerase SlyD